MTTPNHTPGPWRIIDSRDQGEATIAGSDFPAMGFVADVNLCRNNTHQQVDGRANAALIAAAPAMYEALRRIKELMDSGDIEGRDWVEYGQVTNALAQAEDKP